MDRAVFGVYELYFTGLFHKQVIAHFAAAQFDKPDCHHRSITLVFTSKLEVNCLEQTM